MGPEEENVGQRDKGKTLVTRSQSSVPKVKPCGKGSGTSAGTVTHPEGTKHGTAAVPVHLIRPARFCQPNPRCLHIQLPPSGSLGRFLCPCTHAQAPGDLAGPGKPSPWWEATAVKPAGTHRSRLPARLQPGRAMDTTRSADATATVLTPRLNRSLFLHGE